MFKQKFAWRKRSTMTIVDRSESPNFRVRVAQMLSKRRAILLHSTCRGSPGMLGCGGYLTSNRVGGGYGMAVLTRRSATASDSEFARLAHHRAYRDVVRAIWSLG